jgi:hypothetical protein
MGSPAIRNPGLRISLIDSRAVTYARRIAADWRATGLEVGLVEYLSAAGEADGYALTARSPTTILCCVCRCWRITPRFRAGRSLWAIDVFVSRREGAEGGTENWEPMWPAGVAVAAEHVQAWQQVLDWLDDKASLQVNAVSAPAPAGLGRSLLARQGRGSALLAGAVLALGVIAYAGHGALRRPPEGLAVTRAPELAGAPSLLAVPREDPPAAIASMTPAETDAGDLAEPARRTEGQQAALKAWSCAGQTRSRTG